MNAMKYIFRNTLFVLASAMLLMSCQSKKQESEPKPVRDAMIIRVEKVFCDTFQQNLELPATIFANREANLGSVLPGKIEKFHFAEGSFVETGDTLVDLSEETYTQALIELNAIQKDYERVARLLEKNSISQMEYDHIKAKLDASKVKTQMLRKSTQVVAPFSGMIVEYLMEEGENYFFNLALEPGYSNTSGILRLMQLNPIIAKVQINERDINQVFVGQEVNVRVDAIPDKLYKGKIRYIKPILSTMNHSSTVEIEIPNPDLKLKPGMYANCEINMGNRIGNFVSIDAIIRQPGTSEDFVYLIKNDTAYKQLIRRIQTHGAFALIDSLSEGAVVATHGKNKLNHHTPVNIKEN
jgi:membrane fusion protein, multidrug efflux system